MVGLGPNEPPNVLTARRCGERSIVRIMGVGHTGSRLVLSNILRDHISEVHGSVDHLLLSREERGVLEDTLDERVVQPLLVEQSQDSELIIILGLVNKLNFSRESLSSHMVLRWRMDLGVDKVEDLISPVKDGSLVGNETKIISSVTHLDVSSLVKRREKGRHGRGNSEGEKVQWGLVSGALGAGGEGFVNAVPVLRSCFGVLVVRPSCLSLISIHHSL